MKCPKCGKENNKGVSICQHCDFILDPSFLGDDYAQDEQSDSGDFQELGSEDFSEATPSTEQKSLQHPESKDDYGIESEEQEQEETDQDDEDEEIERQLRELREKRGKHSIPHSAADISRDTQTGTDKNIKSDSIHDDLKQTFEGISKFFNKLQKPDKIAMVCAIGMFLFTIFPWVNISNQGSLSGLEVGGWFLWLLSASLGALTYLRQDSHWRKREKYVIITQAVVVGIALIFLLARVITISSLKPVSPDGIPISTDIYSVQVGFGFLFSLAATIGAAVATWMLLKHNVLKK